MVIMKKILCALLEHDLDSNNHCRRCDKQYKCTTCFDTGLIDVDGYAEFCPRCLNRIERNR